MIKFYLNDEHITKHKLKTLTTDFNRDKITDFIKIKMENGYLNAVIMYDPSLKCARCITPICSFITFSLESAFNLCLLTIKK